MSLLLYADVDEQVARLENLPTLPLALRQVQKLMNDPNANMSQISAVITHDQALCTKVLRLVNSAYYGINREITSINHAIVILGLNTVHNLLLGLTTLNLFPRQATSLFDPNKFWEHNLSCGLIARTLAEKHRDLDPEDAFINAFLHDLGKLVMFHFFPELFLEAIKKSKNEIRPLNECEEEIFGWNHCDLGAAVARKWQLPNHIEQSLQDHHSIATIDTPKWIYYTQAANTFCHKFQMGQSGNFYPDTSQHLELKENLPDLESLIQGIQGEVKQTLELWMS